MRGGGATMPGARAVPRSPVVSILRMLAQPALPQLVLTLRGQAPQSLECLARGLALLRGHLRPVADAALEAILLHRLHGRIAPSGAEQALLLVAGHAIPIRRAGPQDA